ncbi:Hydrolase ORFZ [Paramyrothecium foliicola]|nr:Hydrolase ORFZ [Paramyrothecium foliicola]
MHQFFKGQFFNFECVRILGTARYGGAEVAECLEAIGEIQENEPTSWHRAWAEQAVAAEKIATQALSAGHINAARMAYLRASNYTRASAYMMTGESPKTSDGRVPPILHKAGELFRKSMALSSGAVHTLQIPYEGGLELPACLHMPPPSCQLPGKIPLIVNPGGADSIQEEIYYMFPAEGTALGYAILTFDGPGQGLVLHEQNIPMRPDWETVAKLVLDFLIEYAAQHEELELDLDFDRVAIAGASLGGYFALRGMADPRFKACIAVDPIYDLFEFATQHVSPTMIRLWDQGTIPDEVVDNIVWAGMRLSFQTKWEISTAARFLGVESPTGILRAMKKFTLTQKGGGKLGRPGCAAFVTGASNSLYLDFENHTTRVFDQLGTEDKELWVATKPGGGSLQAKMGAMAYCNQRVACARCHKIGLACITAKDGHGNGGPARPARMLREASLNPPDLIGITGLRMPASNGSRGPFSDELQAPLTIDISATSLGMHNEIERMYQPQPQPPTNADLSEIGMEIDIGMPNSAIPNTYEHRGSLCSSTHDTLVGSESLHSDPLGTQAQEKLQDDSPRLFKELLELSAALVIDSNPSKPGFDCNQNEGGILPEATIQRIMNSTFQFFDLLERLAAVQDNSEPSPTEENFGLAQCSASDLYEPGYSHSTRVRHGQGQVDGELPFSHPGSVANHQYIPRRSPEIENRKSKPFDNLVMTTVMTTYALIVRAWRHVYSRIGQLLISGDPITKQIKLPSLQLGGFPIRQNPATQIMVLLEFSCDILQSIRACLGIRSLSARDIGQEESTPRPRRLSMNSACLLVRDTVMSQELSLERQNHSNSDESLGHMHLEEMMDELLGDLDILYFSSLSHCALPGLIFTNPSLFQPWKRPITFHALGHLRIALRISSTMDPSQMPPVDPNDQGLGPSIIGATWFLTLLAGICVGLRMYTRIKVTSQIWSDDWIMIVAMCLQFAYLGFLHNACAWGLGKPPQAFMVAIDDFKQVQLWSWVAMTVGTAVSVIARISIAILLVRIFSLKVWFKWFVIVFTTITAVNGIVSIILSWLYVTPVQAVWDPTIIPTSRWDPRVSGYTAFVLQVFYAFTDLTFALFPVLIVWRLNMALHRKISLIIVLGLGMVTLAAAITKIAIVVITTFDTPTGGGGTNYFQGIVYLTSSIEQAMVIIMGCIPVFQSLTKLDIGSVYSSLASLVLRRKKSSSSLSTGDQNISDPSGYQECELVPKNAMTTNAGSVYTISPETRSDLYTRPGEILREDKFAVTEHQIPRPKENV